MGVISSLFFEIWKNRLNKGFGEHICSFYAKKIVEMSQKTDFFLWKFKWTKLFTNSKTEDIILLSKENVFPDPKRFFIVRYNSVENSQPIKNFIILYAVILVKYEKKECL